MPSAKGNSAPVPFAGLYLYTVKLGFYSKGRTVLLHDDFLPHLQPPCDMDGARQYKKYYIPIFFDVVPTLQFYHEMLRK